MNILLIITGSIAAFKALELTRMLKKEGYFVQIVLSRGGEMFITPLSASALSETEVFTEDSYKMEHITLSRKADIVVICPASASFINKLSSGIGGELSLDICLAKKPETPILLCPAMNEQMYKNEATKESLQILEKRGYILLKPQSGRLLCNEEGIGKLADVSDIMMEIQNILQYCGSLKGKQFLITNGGTIEKIDDVRFISNFSSGLQGSLIAKELLKRGATVFLVEGNVREFATVLHPNCIVYSATSAREMHNICLNLVNKYKFDGFFAVAAVADFYVKNYKHGKHKKENPLILEFEKNPDILKEIGDLKQNRPKVVVGFAAEAENLEKNGILKLKKKNCDLIFANLMAFESSKTEGILLFKSKTKPIIFNGKKHELAVLLIEKLLSLK